VSVLFADAILIVRCLPRMRFLIVEASALLLDLSTYLNPKCGASGLLLPRPSNVGTHDLYGV
jgi:hypothetical protein